jgi:hypothetical protein
MGFDIQNGKKTQTSQKKKSDLKLPNCSKDRPVERDPNKPSTKFQTLIIQIIIFLFFLQG